ncbi:baseplate J/gp47 family protein [Roseomonas xinghualingensis]|uniref:baseplate J/gp47 family protein n=1 Tax=Roseomonas xinghualingensis TaxID=2986475 RepID=UPI0021F1D760|nr:baseplate J/gp47 family protein [Roseomonas sp. SXEYE001]MCV4209385.1 baseplate J/gp47 family protein [Roseomonas sp. SXEYE001]
MPFARPTLETLRRDTRSFVQSRLPADQPPLRHSMEGILADAEAGLAHQQMGYLDWIVRQVIPDAAEGEFLDRWARLVGLTRKPASQAIGMVIFTGTPGIPIDLGTQLTRSDGTTYATTSAAVIGASGSASVPVEAVEGGAAANLAPEARLTMLTAVPGLFNTAMVAAPGFTGGGAEEQDAALQARLRLRLSSPPQGGAASDYVAWALSVPGVTRAWAYPQRRGAGTVDVVFVMDGREDIIPTALDIAAVQAVIDERRPVTADSLVLAPTPQAVNVTFSDLSPNTTVVRAAVAEGVLAQIARDAVPGGTLRKSRLIEAASRASGEGYHTISWPAGDVNFAPGVIGIPGTVTFP